MVAKGMSVHCILSLSISYRYLFYYFGPAFSTYFSKKFKVMSFSDIVKCWSLEVFPSEGFSCKTIYYPFCPLENNDLIAKVTQHFDNSLGCLRNIKPIKGFQIVT